MPKPREFAKTIFDRNGQYDPLQVAANVQAIVCPDERRKYSRFRAAGYYGGIATADGVGCCLNCIFCWSYNSVTQPEKSGLLYTPQEVADRLIDIARQRKFQNIRVSGNEPTIGRQHLLRLLAAIPRDFQFILETNGILIGSDPQYAKDLSVFPNLHVRVSIKGASPEEFSRLTGSLPEGFEKQVTALVYLKGYNVRAHAACMTAFSDAGNIEKLRKQLKRIDPEFANFEEEELILYPAVEQRLSQHGLLRRT